MKISILRLVFVISVLLCTGTINSVFAQVSASRVSWQGAFILWQRPICNAGLACELPTAFSPQMPVHLEFEKPLGVGSHVVVQKTYTFETWHVELLMVWVNPQAGSVQPAYVATQTKLRENTIGVVVECSRYDAADDIHFLPPGSCSGRNQEMMIGFSALSPFAVK